MENKYRAKRLKISAVRPTAWAARCSATAQWYSFTQCLLSGRMQVAVIPTEAGSSWDPAMQPCGWHRAPFGTAELRMRAHAARMRHSPAPIAVLRSSVLTQITQCEISHLPAEQTHPDACPILRFAFCLHFPCHFKKE